jgi:hypothetical protein
VQCGVRNLAISEAAAPYGLYYAPDPSSQIACTIGGNVAENSGGVHCLKYGLTLHNVLRVRGYTAEGEPVEFGSEALGLEHREVHGIKALPQSCKHRLARTRETGVFAQRRVRVIQLTDDLPEAPSRCCHRRAKAVRRPHETRPEFSHRVKHESSVQDAVDRPCIPSPRTVVPRIHP